jgi:hypothetical protein
MSAVASPGAAGDRFDELRELCAAAGLANTRHTADNGGACTTAPQAHAHGDRAHATAKVRKWQRSGVATRLVLACQPEVFTTTCRWPTGAIRRPPLTVVKGAVNDCLAVLRSRRRCGEQFVSTTQG